MLLRLSPKIKINPSKRKQLLNNLSHFSIFMCRRCTAGTSPAEGQGYFYFWLRRTCAKRMQHVLGVLTVRGVTVFRMFWKAYSAKFSICEKIIKFPFLPEVAHQAEVRGLNHPPVSDKQTEADGTSWKCGTGDTQFWKALSDLRWLSKIQIPNTSVTSHTG